MKQFREIKEAIIVVNDGALSIAFGANLNKENENYHDQVSIQIENGGYEIHVKGRRLKSIGISGEIFENDDNFNCYCSKLKGFEERIKITETKKLSWRTFKREVVKSVRSVWNPEYHARRYIYKEDYWPDREYKTNNWVFTEFKAESNDNGGKN